MTLPPQAYGVPGTILDYRPADTTLATNATDLASQAECQLGNGMNVPPGVTNYGFTDTTYLPNTAQILRATTTGQL